MSITATQLKEIRQEFATLKPASVTPDGTHAMTVKQAIFTLAPTLERMKKRGFDTQEIVEKLHEKGIEVKPQTLTKYLTEARRQREGRKAKKRDTAPPPPKREQHYSFIILLIYRMMNCKQEPTERRNRHGKNLRIHPRIQYRSEREPPAHRP